MAIINTTFIGGGSTLEIGDITSKNMSGDNNFVLCNGENIFYAYYPELYNNNYLVQGTGDRDTVSWRLYSDISPINSNGASQIGGLRRIGDYYVVDYVYNNYGSTTTRTQLVPINDILSASSSGTITYPTIRKFKDLWIYYSGSSSSEGAVYYKDTITGSSTAASGLASYSTYYPIDLVNTDKAVIVTKSEYIGGSSASILRSSDGKNYTQISSTYANGNVLCNGELFLSLMKSSNTAYYSDDAENWESVTLPITMPSSISSTYYYAFEGAFFLFDSPNNVLYGSKDCVNWCKIEEVKNPYYYYPYRTYSGTSTSPDESSSYNISYCNGKYFIRRSSDIVWTEDFITLNTCEYFVTAFLAGSYYSERGYISNDLLNWEDPSRSGFRLGVYNSEGILFAFDYSTYTGTAQSQTRGTWYYSSDGTNWMGLVVTSGSAPCWCFAAGGYLFYVYQNTTTATRYVEILYKFPNYSTTRYMKVK